MARRRKRKTPLSAAGIAARKVENELGQTLRSVARECGKIVKELFDEDDLQRSSGKAQRRLERYAEYLRPWAYEVAERAVTSIHRRDDVMWRKMAQETDRPIREELKQARGVDGVMQRQIRDTVGYILSIPLEAAARIEIYRVRAAASRQPVGEIVEAIKNTGEVAKSRANAIALGQVAETSFRLLRTKSRHLGSEGYIWCTMEDKAVRHVHVRLSGKFIRWDTPPIAEKDGRRYHAGERNGCRCWAQPVIPDAPGAIH